MATEKIKLTADWQQLTTGTESVFIQSRAANVALCDSQTKPDNTMPFVVVTEAGIFPPAVIWAKTFTLSLDLIVMRFQGK
ncbi:hypothetical protein NGB58_04695 [Escherichia coli]|nr:hypothetical protein [Escherichia coli]